MKNALELQLRFPGPCLARVVIPGDTNIDDSLRLLADAEKVAGIGTRPELRDLILPSQNQRVLKERPAIEENLHIPSRHRTFIHHDKPPTSEGPKDARSHLGASSFADPVLFASRLQGK